MDGCSSSQRLHSGWGRHFMNEEDGSVKGPQSFSNELKLCCCHFAISTVCLSPLYGPLPLNQTHFNRWIKSSTLPCSLHLQTWIILKSSVNSSVVLWYDATQVSLWSFIPARYSTVNYKWYYWTVEVFRKSRISAMNRKAMSNHRAGHWCVKVANDMLIPKLKISILPLI